MEIKYEREFYRFPPDVVPAMFISGGAGRARAARRHFWSRTDLKLGLSKNEMGIRFRCPEIWGSDCPKIICHRERKKIQVRARGTALKDHRNIEPSNAGFVCRIGLN